MTLYNSNPAYANRFSWEMFTVRGLVFGLVNGRVQMGEAVTQSLCLYLGIVGVLFLWPKKKQA